ncbi:tetratricopeptide repeat protein [Nitrosomonas oligotropha]|uniref:Tetratricopeptide repeat protein n=1 Tax=Nitrosomonas oligotropha TaxID=42354 RepID=A0A2T5HYQ4_9PROT|nr:tetratricopeptide repeat protein [Nitrosomonas oligotropha]PTQ76608.1 tetratricopeptide repeat protein [Nitrosomonas oligotropha]
MHINPLDISTPATELNFSGKNVLIVDDYMEMRSILRDMLSSCGAEMKKIHMATNGNEAIAWLKKVPFDIVLCDLILGSGKNGQQVLEEAKYQSLVGPSCLWLMITAEKTMEAVTGTAEYQPDAYLLKPVTEASLRSRLAKIWTKKEAFAEIYKAIKQQDYSKAMYLCDQRLASDKAHAADLLRTKCDLLLVSGEYDRAKQVLEDILAVRDLPWAKAALAKILLKKNDLDAAKHLLEETTEANPAYLEAQDLLAHTLQVMGNLEEAGSVLERTVKLSPNSVTRQKNLGQVAMKLGKLEDAERAFRKSVTLGENSVLRTADAYLGLAKACSANKNAEQALKVLGQLNKNFAADEVRTKALAVEGLIHHQSGNTEKAKQIADELGQSISNDSIHPDSDGALEIARLLLTTGDKEKAIQLLQSEIKNNPESATLLRDVAEIFDQAGMGEEGSRLIETSRQEAMLIMNRGVLLISKGQYEEALSAMRDAYSAMPANIRVLLNLAYVIITYMQKKGPAPELIEEARHSLQAANELSPGEPRFVRLSAALNELTTLR